ncbi:MAG TPA: class I SAM-dependent methyltransferase [Mucilaginibacter sp.]|nr:class I SAM-dependent methyltransferase [Mucilaginibacter sp.]
MTGMKTHWENVYDKHPLTDVSWYEPVPGTSLSIIKRFKLPKNAAIIDIGAGDSLLVDHLLLLGYSDITVLDISEKAIQRAKARLGDKEKMVKWVVCDVLDYHPSKKYDLWHDRATFHFFTTPEEKQRYLDSAHQNLKPDGYLVLSTFSLSGPEKCSGLPVEQYSEKKLSDMLARYFEKVRCITKAHITPWHAIQNFIYCSFKNRPLDTTAGLI